MGEFHFPCCLLHTLPIERPMFNLQVEQKKSGLSQTRTSAIRAHKIAFFENTQKSVA